jgi:hypothetical protein
MQLFLEVDGLQLLNTIDLLASGQLSALGM